MCDGNVTPSASLPVGIFASGREQTVSKINTSLDDTIINEKADEGDVDEPEDDINDDTEHDVNDDTEHDDVGEEESVESDDREEGSEGEGEGDLPEELQTQLDTLSTLYKQSHSMARRHPDGSYTESFCQLMEKIETASDDCHECWWELEDDQESTAAERLLKSGIVDLLCDVIVEGLGSHSRTFSDYTTTHSPLTAAMASLNNTCMYDELSSEFSYKVCIRMRDDGRLLPVLLETLRDWYRPHMDATATETQIDILTKSLEIICHTARLDDKDTADRLCELGTTDVLVKYLNSADWNNMKLAAGTLRYTVTEQEAGKLASADGICTAFCEMVRIEVSWADELIENTAICQVVAQDGRGVYALVEKVRQTDEKQRKLRYLRVLSPLCESQSMRTADKEQLLDLAVAQYRRNTETDHFSWRCRDAARDILKALRDDLERTPQYRQLCIELGFIHEDGGTTGRKRKLDDDQDSLSDSDTARQLSHTPRDVHNSTLHIPPLSSASHRTPVLPSYDPQCLPHLPDELMFPQTSEYPTNPPQHSQQGPLNLVVKNTQFTVFQTPPCPTVSQIPTCPTVSQTPFCPTVSQTPSCPSDPVPYIPQRPTIQVDLHPQSGLTPMCVQPSALSTLPVSTHAVGLHDPHYCSPQFPSFPHVSQRSRDLSDVDHLRTASGGFPPSCEPQQPVPLALVSVASRPTSHLSSLAAGNPVSNSSLFQQHQVAGQSQPPQGPVLTKFSHLRSILTEPVMTSAVQVFLPTTAAQRQATGQRTDHQLMTSSTLGFRPDHSLHSSLVSGRPPCNAAPPVSTLPGTSHGHTPSTAPFSVPQVLHSADNGQSRVFYPSQPVATPQSSDSTDQSQVVLPAQIPFISQSNNAPTRPLSLPHYPAPPSSSVCMVQLRDLLAPLLSMSQSLYPTHQPPSLSVTQSRDVPTTVFSAQQRVPTRYSPPLSQSTTTSPATPQPADHTAQPLSSGPACASACDHKQCRAIHARLRASVVTLQAKLRQLRRQVQQLRGENLGRQQGTTADFPQTRITSPYKVTGSRNPQLRGNVGVCSPLLAYPDLHHGNVRRKQKRLRTSVVSSGATVNPTGALRNVTGATRSATGATIHITGASANITGATSSSGNTAGALPKAGVYTREEATDYGMIQLISGHPVYLYPSDMRTALNECKIRPDPSPGGPRSKYEEANLAASSRFVDGPRLARRLLQVFFTQQERQAGSIADRPRATHLVRLNKTVTDAILACCRARDSTTNKTQVQGAMGSALTELRARKKLRK